MVVPTMLARRMRRACRASGRRFESSKGQPRHCVIVLPILHLRSSRKSVCSGSPRNGRCRSPGGRRAVSRRVSGAPSIGTTTMIVAMLTASRGTHSVAGAPTTVVIAVRLVIAAGVANAAFNSHTGYRASTQHQQCRRANHQSTVQGFHFGSALVSLSLHSIKPNGAPAGSATTATIPPWRSTRGSTKTRPPIAATLAAVSAAFSTRTKFSQ
jgi:hypothetical protein